MIIGSKKSFAFEIGEKISARQIVVDIWALNNLLTDFDNLVYTPQFVFSIEKELEIIKSRKIPKGFIALHWGPTTDSLIARFTLRNYEDIQINFKHDNGKKISISVKLAELIQIYEQCINELKTTIQS